MSRPYADAAGRRFEISPFRAEDLARLRALAADPDQVVVTERVEVGGVARHVELAEDVRHS